MSRRIRVAILEASAEVHVAIAALPAAEPDVDVVRPARTAAELAGLCDAGVDVLIADLGILGRSDGEPLQMFRSRCPHVRVVLTTSGEEGEYRDAAARLAADVWLPKTRLAGELLEALRRIAT